MSGGLQGGLSVDVEHRQGDFALRTRFDVPNGVTAIFGRSGSGKTTLARIVAGLIRPRRGRVVVDGTALVDTDRGIWIPPHRRRIGFVFQDAQLLPHLDVRQNLLFGRWFSRDGDRGPDLAEVVALLGIAPLLGRRPAGLSGGERQRVAIGRALLARPRLLVMDEPLASLDDDRKAEILPFLERLRDETRVPIAYVTHALPEILRLADTMVRLDGGTVLACGPTADVMARFDLVSEPGAGSVLDAIVVAHDDTFGLTRLSTVAGDVHVPRTDDAAGSRRRVMIQPRDVTLSLDRAGRTSSLNVFSGTVAEVAETDGAAALVRVDCNGASIVANITRKSRHTLALVPGMRVDAVVKSVAVATGQGVRRRS